jgi:hypothetical protein
MGRQNDGAAKLSAQLALTAMVQLLGSPKMVFLQ